MSEPQGSNWKLALNRFLRAILLIVLLLVGAVFIVFDMVGINNEIVILIFGQLLPFFFGPFMPFAFGDICSLKVKLLDEGNVLDQSTEYSELSESKKMWAEAYRNDPVNTQDA